MLAAAAQAGVIAGATAAFRMPSSQLPKVLAAVLAADLMVALLVYGIGVSNYHFSDGGERRRLAIAFGHLLAATVVSWVVWGLALRLAVVPRAALLGGALFIVTAVGLTLPGVDFPWRQHPARVCRVTVTLPGLPPPLEGTRILLLSDLHVGPYLSIAQARRLLAPLRGLTADLVVFDGDLTSEDPAHIDAAAALLAEMAPPAPRFAVLGNHDHWTNAPAVTSALKAHGFDVLVNDSRATTLRGTPVWVAGVDDPTSRRVSPREALSRVPPDAFAILLSHRPDIVGDAAARRANLILSGHTHGGQVVLPLLGTLVSNSWYGARYVAGLSRVGHTALFTTRGLGVVVIPVRVFCDPEIDLLELHGGGPVARGVGSRE